VNPASVSARPVSDSNRFFMVAGEIVLQTWPEIRKDHTPDCCLPACQVVKNLLKRYGYHGELVQVTLAVWNQKMWAKAASGGTLETAEEIERWRREGCYSVIIGHPLEPRAPGKIGCHFVVKATDGRQNLLLDTSLKQAERPRQDIFLPVGLMGSYALDEAPAVEFQFEQVVGKRVYLTYTLREKPDDFYKTSPDWMTERWMPVADRVFARMQINFPLNQHFGFRRVD